MYKNDRNETASKALMSIRPRSISSILKVESSSKFLRQIDVIISMWIRLSKSMKSQRTFHVEFRRRVDRESTNMCPLGME